MPINQSDTLVESGFAGALATLPMTVVLELIRRNLRWREQYALEPRLITDAFLEWCGAHHLSDAQRGALAALLHMGYGTAVGIGLGELRVRPTHSRLLNGLATGMAVWAAGYMGWLPLMGILPTPDRRPRGRNVGIIAAHLVWGVCNEYLRKANEELGETAVRPTHVRSNGPLDKQPDEARQ